VNGYAGHDVIDLERCRDVGVWEVAILATDEGSLSDLVLDRRAHA
jgi:hypothetical protein